MKAYIESALSTIYTPLYSKLCVEIIKDPANSKEEIMAIKKMLLNSYYSSSVRPFENIELTNADFGIGVYLWLAFADHPNDRLLHELSLGLQYADEDLIVLTVKMVNSLSQCLIVKECTGIWGRFIADLDKSIKSTSDKKAS